jgi:hypothetical protein
MSKNVAYSRQQPKKEKKNEAKVHKSLELKSGGDGPVVKLFRNRRERRREKPLKTSLIAVCVSSFV